MKIEITLTETVANKTFGCSTFWDVGYCGRDNAAGIVDAILSRLRDWIKDQKLEAGISDSGAEHVRCRMVTFQNQKVINWHIPVTETASAQIAKFGVEQYDIECRHRFDQYRPEVAVA